MGHVTIVNQDIKVARKIAEDVKNTIRVIAPQTPEGGVLIAYKNSN
jgi:hypothetical protein